MYIFNLNPDPTFHNLFGKFGSSLDENHCITCESLGICCQTKAAHLCLFITRYLSEPHAEIGRKQKICTQPAKTIPPDGRSLLKNTSVSIAWGRIYHHQEAVYIIE